MHPLPFYLGLPVFTQVLIGFAEMVVAKETGVGGEGVTLPPRAVISFLLPEL